MLSGCTIYLLTLLSQVPPVAATGSSPPTGTTATTPMVAPPLSPTPPAPAVADPAPETPPTGTPEKVGNRELF